MRRIIGILKVVYSYVLPKRGEIPLILLGLLLMLVLLVPDLVKSGLWKRQSAISPWLEFSPLMMFCLSLAAALGTFGWRELKRCLWFVVAVVVVLAFGIFLFYREGLLSKQSFDPYLHGTHNDSVSATFVWVTMLGGMLGLFLVTKLFFWLVNYVKSRFQFAELTRQKLMIAVAVVLFICLTVRNVLSQNNLSLGTGVFQGPVYLAIEGAVALLLVVVFPTWLINQIRGWLGLLIGGAYLGVITGFSGSFVTIQAQMMLAIYSVIFTILVVSLTCYLGLLESQFERGSSNEEANASRVSTSTVRWSFWGGLTLLIAVLAIFVQWNFNGQALVLGGDDRFELARRLKKLSTNRDVNGNFGIWNGTIGGQGPVYVMTDVRLNDDAKSDCLSELSDPTNEYQLNLSNLNPNIDTSKTKSLSKPFVSISSSNVSIQQLSDLLAGTTYVSLNNITIEEPIVKDSFASLANINVFRTQPGEVSKLLQAIDKTKFKGRLNINQAMSEAEMKSKSIDGKPVIQDKLNDDDWEKILNCSDSFELSVYRTPAKRAIEFARKNKVGKKLYVNFDPSDSQFWNLICNTHISTGMSQPNSKETIEKFLEAVLASRGELWASRIFGELVASSGDIDTYFFREDSPWVFQRNQNESPTAMLLPGESSFFERVGEYVELETLSFDVRWLQALQRFPDSSIPVSHDISVLGKLTKLKRLDMPVGFWGRDYSFLSSLPELEHLQFDVMADGSKNVVFGFKAADCPNLNSLVLIGQPSKAMALEIGKLPKLKTLKVLDVNQSLATPKSISQLQAAIGAGVKLTIVVADEDRPAVPEEFTKHLEKVRAEIRKKYLGSAD